MQLIKSLVWRFQKFVQMQTYYNCWLWLLVVILLSDASFFVLVVPILCTWCMLSPFHRCYFPTKLTNNINPTWLVSIRLLKYWTSFFFFFNIIPLEDFSKQILLGEVSEVKSSSNDKELLVFCVSRVRSCSIMFWCIMELLAVYRFRTLFIMTLYVFSLFV